jgi:hypothetical protein
MKIYHLATFSCEQICTYRYWLRHGSMTFFPNVGRSCQMVCLHTQILVYFGNPWISSFW